MFGAQYGKSVISFISLVSEVCSREHWEFLIFSVKNVDISSVVTLYKKYENYGTGLTTLNLGFGVSISECCQNQAIDRSYNNQLLLLLELIRLIK